MSQVGSNIINYGGTIYSMNSNLTVGSSAFLNSSAQAGGSIALLCSKDQRCDFSITNSSFINSTAIVKGGAIYYDLYRPLFKGNEYSNNRAEYGNNIASYPIQIKLKNSSSNLAKVNLIASGQVIKDGIEFVLADHDNQIINIDSSSTVKISSITNNTSTRGTVETVFNKGVAKFNKLILQAQPGLQNVVFKIDSPAIDKQAIQLIYGSTFSHGKINVSFRN